MEHELYDLLIVGAGPAGLSAAREARRLGLKYLVLERRFVADTISQYPIGKPLFSTPEEIELAPGALHCRGEKPTREELLIHYTRFAVDEIPNIHTNEAVEAIRSVAGRFEVVTSAASYAARNVLVATGINGERKRLGVPGETSDRVCYRFVEAFPYAGRDVLVVGDGHSAAEAAMFLEEVGARVTLVMRRSGFAEDPARKKAAIKWWVREPLQGLIEAGRLTLHFGTQVVSLGPDEALLENGRGDRWSIACDAVFALLGTRPDLKILRDAGVVIGEDGLPAHDPETFETDVAGLYVAGHITHEPHIKGALRVGPLVAARVASTLAPAGA